jgi:tripartite-type tricarboxylate transporter receptor subunit TctC
MRESAPGKGGAMTRRSLFPAPACALSVLAVATAGLLEPARAQTYPERTVRIIAPTAPGGSIDTTARVIAAKLAELWG